MSNSRGAGRAANTQPKRRFTAVTVAVVVIILLFIGALIINSSFLRRQATAVEANGMKLSPAEYQYFYIGAINEHRTMMNNALGDSASSFLPDSSKSLDSQTNVLTGQLWSEYYDEATAEDILVFTGAYQEALASGYTLTDEDYAELISEIDAFEEEIDLYYKWSFQEYLDYQYGSGSGLNEELYRELNKKQYYVSMYMQSTNDALTYSESEIDAYYDEHSDDFDYFKYRYFTVRAETVNEDDFEDTADYEAAKKAAVDDARSKAAQYVATISNELDFIEKAAEYNPDSYSTDTSTLYHTSGENMSTTFDEWIKDPARKAGDLYSSPANSDESANNAFFVVYFVERLKNDYPSVNLNLMMVTGQTISTDDYQSEAGELQEEAYNATVEDEARAIQTLVDELLEEWTAAGGTEEFLTDYYAENSSVEYGSLEQYSATISGSVYNNIRMSYGIDDKPDEWMHDSSRKEGDFTAIKSNDSTWYFMYFLGKDVDYADYLADTAMRQDAITAMEDAYKTGEVSVRWAMKLL